VTFLVTRPVTTPEIHISISSIVCVFVLAAVCISSVSKFDPRGTGTVAGTGTGTVTGTGTGTVGGTGTGISTLALC